MIEYKYVRRKMNANKFQEHFSLASLFHQRNSLFIIFYNHSANEQAKPVFEYMLSAVEFFFSFFFLICVLLRHIFDL